MDERDGFLRAIHDEPDDDVHRLVFADWLEDHDEPEWSALIRHQCGMARLLVRGTDPFWDTGSLELSSLTPKLQDTISSSLGPLPKSFTARPKRRSQQSQMNQYVLMIQRGIPEHLRLVENDALRGLLTTLQATRGNWGRSLRLLSFGRHLRQYSLQYWPNQPPSHTMLGRLFRSEFLSNFSDIDLRNYNLDEHETAMLPRRWPASTRLWVSGRGIGLMANLEQIQSRLGPCLVVDPKHPGDQALMDDIPF